MRRRTSIHYNWRTYYTCEVRHSQSERGDRYVHLVIKKRSGRDGITWDILQLIKDDVAGKEASAVEVYPPTHQLINEINARHLWILPDDLTERLPSLAH